mmetsp:Transcript_105033/g.186062  ORF Transcript_105033/g.186062 Transcript_105033/m.186062 type:complete len:758 (-) Transcript_105033:57-2330(-)
MVRHFIIGRLLLVATPPGFAVELPLYQERLAACDGLDDSAIYIRGSNKTLYLMGGFRTNPLPEAFLPSVHTVSTQRVDSFQDYMWTLSPYLMGASILIVAMWLICPCCCGYICFVRSKQRVPFVPLAGICFNITFALLALLMLLALLVAVEEHGKAWRAYSRAKCAAYTVMDTLVNGDRMSMEAQSGFLGFRNMMAAITASSNLFPDALLKMDAVMSALHDGSEDEYPKQGEEYYTMWNHLHRRDMEVTPFHCMLCESASLQPLLVSIQYYNNASQTLQNFFSEVKRDISETEPMLRSAMQGTLSDVEGLYKLSFSYSEQLRNFVLRCDRLRSRMDVALCIFSACSVVCLVFGVASLLVCKGGCCAFTAWWFAYVSAVGLLALAGTFFSATTAAHDVAGLLQHVLTEDGVELYNRSLLQNLNLRQRAVVNTCLVPRGTGKLSEWFSLSGGPMQVQDAAHLRASKKALDASMVNESQLGSFFKKYKTYSGNSYVSSWNTTQTLGWLNEASGVSNMLNELYKLTGEHWTFHDAQAPAGCAMALDFDPSTQVAQFNCFWVTDSRPTPSELKQRYAIRLNENQLTLLYRMFARARVTSSALKSARTFGNTNTQAVLRLQDKWRDSSQTLNKAVEGARRDVGGPMVKAMDHISGLTLAMNCSSAHDACLGGMQALGNDFVAAFLVLSSCIAVLASCSIGLAFLYCMLWSIQQQGPAYAFKKVGRNGNYSDSGSEDSSEGDYYEDARELQQLLSKVPRGAKRP